MSKHSPSRRQFVKRAAYVAPVILTLQAAPSFAKAGSAKVVVPPAPGGGVPGGPTRPPRSIFQAFLDWLANLLR